MKSNRFTLLTWAVPLIVCLLVLALTVPALADRYTYIHWARNDSGADTPGFTKAGLQVSGARFSGPLSGLSASGAGPYVGPGIVNQTTYLYTQPFCYYMSDTGTLWGQWSFVVPDDVTKSGYYDVYMGTRYGVLASQDIPPVWTINNAGGTFTNSTWSGTAASNVWSKIATGLQFNRGQTYTTRCANKNTAVASKRQNMDAIAWVFVGPNAPTNLTAIAEGGVDIKLDWTAPTAPVTYTIERKAWSDGTYEWLADVAAPATTYTDTTGVTDVEYYYRVKSTDATPVVSSWSDEVHLFKAITTVPARKATNPSPVDTATLVQTNASLSWTAAPAATSHDVYFGTNSAALTLVSGAQAGTTYAPVGMAPLTTYYWRIDERNSFGAGAAGDVWSYTTSGAPGPATGPNPADLATLVHTDLGDATIPGSVSWTAGAGVVSHDVYFGTVNPPVTKVSAAQAGTSYATGALLANTNYYWRVDEVNSVGTTTGPVWTFQTGVPLTVIPIRAENRGTIVWYGVNGGEGSAGRAWNTTTWHPATDTVDLGTTANNPPYTWVGWSLNADGTAPFSTSTDITYPVSATNRNLYAVYAGTHYTVNGVADPVAGGTVTITDQTWPSAANTEFEVGDIAHVVAVPAAGYLFAGWASDKAGTFGNALAADTTYAITPDAVTTVTAYFATAVTNIVASGTRAIAANNLLGTENNDWWTTQINIGAYTTSPVENFSRVLCQFNDWAGFSTIPALSLRQGLGKVTSAHTSASNFDGGSTIQVSAFPILTPWVYSTNDVGAWWLTTDGTIPWTTPGGDMDTAHELGTRQPFVGNPSADVAKTWTLTTGLDYRTLLANGIEFRGVSGSGGVVVPVNGEGIINARKGFSKNSAIGLFYNPPSGAENVIRDWAYLGAYGQGVDNDHQLRLDTDVVTGTYNGIAVNETTIAPSAGKSYGNTYGTYAWALGSSPTDLVDLIGANFYNAAKPDSSTYCAVYVNNPGASIWPAYIALGSDDYSRVWTNGTLRGTKAVAQGVSVDQAMIGPFTLLGGWTRVVVKVENGSTAYGVTARLANADRTAITGLTFATNDATPPTNPAATAADGVTSGVSQTAVNNPLFTFTGAADPQGTGEGVSGLRGLRVYFGSDPAGVPTDYQTAWTYQAPAQTAGTYYLRVKTVDVALNESAAETVFTFVLGEATPKPTVGVNGKAVRDAIMGTASANYKFTVWGWVTVIDANSFTVDDGSSLPVKVLKTGHGFTSADYVSATGTLDVSVPSAPVLTALTVKKQN